MIRTNRTDATALTLGEAAPAQDDIVSDIDYFKVDLVQQASVICLR